MGTTTTRNGVNVERLVATVGAVQADPGIAKFTFRARSNLADPVPVGNDLVVLD